MKKLTIALTLLLTCSVAKADPITLSMKQQILEAKSRIWKDPDSVRDASISSETGWCSFWGPCICIEANAKNSFGGYTGIRRTVIVFNSYGAINSIDDAGTDGFMLVCRGMRPFPELNGKVGR
jgi:hypothetical protein